MKVVALLTGRGNNTLKDKNILPVLGKPLLFYPAMAAKKSSYITDFYVSSDDNKILDAAEQLGYKKIKRPEILARPDSQHIDAILHALQYMEEQDNLKPDILVVLLANSGIIKTEWISESISIIIKDEVVSAVVPVMIDQDHHPFRAKRMDSEGFLSTFFDFSGKKISTNRQDLEICYYLCHNFWTLNVTRSVYCEQGQQPWTFMGDKIKPIVVEESFDVHDEDDILRTEKWLLSEGITY